MQVVEPRLPTALAYKVAKPSLLKSQVFPTITRVTLYKRLKLKLSNPRHEGLH